MGQLVSKTAKGGSTVAAAAVKQAATAPSKTNLPASNVSATAAAARAAAEVRSPSFVTPPSAQDLTQRQILQQTLTQTGRSTTTTGDGSHQSPISSPPSSPSDTTTPDESSSTAHEMPDDLVSFLKNAGPLHKQDAGSTAATTPRQHKMPRSALSHQDNVPSSTAGRRVVESMPLAEKIQGFETTKSTSFSQQAPAVDPHIYQWGTTRNIYQLLKHKEHILPTNPTTADTNDDDTVTVDKDAATAAAYDDIVQQTYEAYSQQFEVPPAHIVQQQQTWLKHTLHYLDIPVLMKDKDNADSYDGVPPSQVHAYETMKLYQLSPTRARLVLEDLNDREQSVSAGTKK